MQIYYSHNLDILHCNKKRELKDKWISRFAFKQSFFQVLLNHYVRFFRVGGLLLLSFYTKLPVFTSNIFFYIFFPEICCNSQNVHLQVLKYHPGVSYKSMAHKKGRTRKYQNNNFYRDNFLP